MGTWMPQIDPMVLRAALSPSAQVPPQPVRPVTRIPLPPPATDLPVRAGAPTSMPAAPIAPVAASTPTPTMGSPDPTAQLRSRYNAMPAPTAPPPSDNPAIAPQQDENPFLSAIKRAQTGLDTERQRVDTMMGQQPTRPNYEDYKPKLWQKILAPFVGALSGREAGPVVSGMLYGRWNRAQNAYDQANKAWSEKMGFEERAGIPLAADQLRAAQEASQNWINARKVAETERHNQETEQFHNDLNEIRRMYDEGRLKDAQQRIDETAERNKNNAEFQRQLAEIRDRMATARERQVDEKANRVSQHDLTDSEKLIFNQKTRRLQSEAQQLTSDRAKIISGPFANSDYGKKKLAPIDQRLQEIDDAMAKAQEDIIAQRSGGGGTRTAPAAPAKQAVPRGYTRIQASDGSLHDIPNDKLDAAKKRDPGLKVQK